MLNSYVDKDSEASADKEQDNREEASESEESGMEIEQKLLWL